MGGGGGKEGGGLEWLSERRAEAAAVARQAPVVLASTRAEGGLDGLKRWIGPGQTVALLGSSGVGKSSIVNALVGEARLRTAEVRVSDSRGRHTTVRRELIPLEGGGALIDTPGMRELQLWVAPEGLDTVFDEIAELGTECRFRDCTHTGEPGCAVAAGLAEGRVDEARMASYRKLRAEAEWHESQADPLAALERKKKWKAIHKEIKRYNQKFRD